MHKFHLATSLTLVFFLVGCATRSEQSLYQWETYQSQVLAHLRGEAPEAQIEALERDLEKIGAKNNIPPPGFYAHLGMLYAEAGNDARAIVYFMLEKKSFPEAATLMDRFLKRYQGN